MDPAQALSEECSENRTPKNFSIPKIDEDEYNISSEEKWPKSNWKNDGESSKAMENPALC